MDRGVQRGAYTGRASLVRRAPSAGPESWGARETRKWLVVGLGNPGSRYERTRHNAGFAVLALLAQRHDARFRHAWLGARGETARLQCAGAELTLLRPLTFMNASGTAVRPFMRQEGGRDGFRPTDMVLVYDDMDVPTGRLRLRPDGRAGGHRGVSSVLSAAGSEAIARIRVGIGRPEEGQDAAEYVLSDIPPVERGSWEACLQRAANAVEAVCTDGLEAAMARFNGPGTA